MKDYFNQKGIPSLILEGSFQVGPPTGQVMTRIRAFMEMFLSEVPIANSQ